MTPHAAAGCTGSLATIALVASAERPECGALHQVLREHLETFLERVNQDP